MTEYWVSQKRKWCEYCKIFLADNMASIKMHEYGERHKENVARKLSTIRKDASAAEREKKQTARDLQRIEAAAKRQYEKDLAAQQKATAAEAAAAAAAASSPAAPSDAGGSERGPGHGPPAVPAEPPEASAATSSSGAPDEWVQDEATGYYFNAASGYHYDANSGLYYSDILGKWTTQEEALQASRGGAAGTAAAARTPTAAAAHLQVPRSGSPAVGPRGQKAGDGTTGKKAAAASAAPTPAPGTVRKGPIVPGKGGRGVPSSLEVAKRKREEKGAGPLSAEEVAARQAREAARRRTEERDKRTLGLYQSF